MKAVTLELSVTVLAAIAIGAAVLGHAACTAVAMFTDQSKDLPQPPESDSSAIARVHSTPTPSRTHHTFAKAEKSLTLDHWLFSA